MNTSKKLRIALYIQLVASIIFTLCNIARADYSIGTYRTENSIGFYGGTFYADSCYYSVEFKNGY